MIAEKYETINIRFKETLQSSKVFVTSLELRAPCFAFGYAGHNRYKSYAEQVRVKI